MYRIRLHGRGGQGIKTGGQVLGTAFFLEGFQVQDAPRYGAERRGAPIVSHVRAARSPIHERGAIARPDLVVVADDTLVALPSAGVLLGAEAGTVLLIAGDLPADAWRERAGWPGPVVALPGRAGRAASGLDCAAAAAALLGVIRRESLARAVGQERPASLSQAEADAALAVFDALARRAGLVGEGEDACADSGARPDWIDLGPDDASVATPDIDAPGNSVLANTGLWRTWRPEIDASLCHRCSWICGTLCPDSAIRIAVDRSPSIDYDHCKGCLVCGAVCPTHAISAVPERDVPA